MMNSGENYTVKLPDHKVYITENGKEQANNAGLFLKQYLVEKEVDLTNAILWVSPYTRTRQTANIINGYLQIADKREDPTLIEQQYGLFSYDTWDECKIKYPNEYQLYDKYYQMQGKFYAKLPQGESPFDVAVRLKLFLHTIFRDLKQGRDTLFIVCHGAVMKAFLLNWFHKSPEWYCDEITPPNCSIIEINRDKKQKMSNFQYIWNAPQSCDS